MAYKKTVALNTGCNASFEYQGKGNLGAWIPDSWMKGNAEIFKDAMGNVANLSPLNDIAVIDGKISIELDFRLVLECFKDETRADKCRNGYGCKAKVIMDFTFWLDIDYMFPDSIPGKKEFEDCLNSWVTIDSGCILAHGDYLQDIIELKGTNSAASKMWDAGFNAWLEGAVPDYLEAKENPAHVGVPGGVWQAMMSIGDSIKAWDILKLTVICACLPDPTFSVTNHQATIQAAIDGPTGKGKEWEDIIAHYVRSYWNAATTGDTDYITYIESYDEIITLAADARRLGRS